LRIAFAALAALAATAAAALQWDLSAGDYHTHLLSSDAGFELHLHDKATHAVVDTTRGKVVATLLAGGKREEVPLRPKQAGILAGARPLKGDWTLLFRVEMPGRKPAQLRYSSKMKPGSQDVAAGHSHAKDDHDHDHGHDHDHDHPKKR
jgi:hypothetical protein